MSSFKVEVQTDTTGVWYSNSMRYDVKETAEREGANLAWRWTLVKDWRVSESEDRPNYRLVDGELQSIIY